MKKLFSNRKGMFFSLLAYFLISSLMILFFAGGNQSNLGESLALIRLHDLSESVEEGIKEILSLHYDLSAEFQGPGSDGTVNITFHERLSRGNKNDWGKEFSKTVQSFEEFVESHEQSIDINISALQNKEFPIKISPYNLTYSRSWKTGQVEVSIKPDSGAALNFEGYEITVDGENQEIDKTTAQLRKAGNFLFKTASIDNFGTNILDEKRVDPSDNHKVQVFFAGGNKVTIDLKDNNLDIVTNSDQEVSIFIKLIGLPPMDEKPRVVLFKDAVITDFPGLGVKKSFGIELEG